MTHKWLLKENVENAPVGAYWSPALKRGFIVDWLEMRGLLERLIAVRSIDELPEAAEVWSDVVDMLEETSDD